MADRWANFVCLFVFKWTNSSNNVRHYAIGVKCMVDAGNVGEGSSFGMVRKKFWKWTRVPAGSWADGEVSERRNLTRDMWTREDLHGNYKRNKRNRDGDFCPYRMYDERLFTQKKISWNYLKEPYFMDNSN